MQKLRLRLWLITGQAPNGSSGSPLLCLEIFGQKALQTKEPAKVAVRNYHYSTKMLYNWTKIV